MQGDLAKNVEQLVALIISIINENINENIDENQEHNCTEQHENKNVADLEDVFSKYTNHVNDLFHSYKPEDLSDKAKEGLEISLENSTSDSKVSTTNRDDHAKLNEFIVVNASQSVSNLLITGLIDSASSLSAAAAATAPAADKKCYTYQKKIAFLLDFLIWLALKVDECAKPAFYQTLLTALQQLLAISTDEAQIFWNYLEARLDLIKNGLFHNNVGERMQILQLTNTLIDKFRTTKVENRADLYKKDTQDDVFQSRVRSFVTQLLKFDDTTGLNKYFHLANRKPVLIYVKDDFLLDLLEVQKVFNNPIHFMKKLEAKNLKRLGSKIQTVLQELFQDERNYRNSSPLADPLKLKQQKPDTERKFLNEKISTQLFVPETYFESHFLTPKDEAFAELQKRDGQYVSKELKASKSRLQYICEIYIVVSLYSDLSQSAKLELLRDIGSPAGSKHLTDEDLPHSTAKYFLDIKKDILAEMKRIDSALYHTLLNLNVSEKSWWRWLLVGKDLKYGGVYFSDLLLSSEELERTETSLKEYLPFKNKKSFNTYVTPQVSRKMRTPLGLKQLKLMKVFNVEHALKELEEIRECDKNDEVDHIYQNERRCSLVWKTMRKRRTQDWLASTADLLEKSKDKELKKDEEIQIQDDEKIAEVEEQVKVEEKGMVDEAVEKDNKMNIEEISLKRNNEEELLSSETKKSKI